MALLFLVLCLILATFLLVVLVTQLRTYYLTRVPFIATARADIVDLAKRLPVKSSDIVLDLGSGDGRVLLWLEKLTKATVRGYELSGWPLWYARLKKRYYHSRADFIAGSFFDYGWSEATVIYVYLFPFLLPKIWLKAKSECSPGTKVVSRDFRIPDVKPNREWKTPTGHTIRVYIV